MKTDTKPLWRGWHDVQPGPHRGTLMLRIVRPIAGRLAYGSSVITHAGFKDRRVRAAMWREARESLLRFMVGDVRDEKC